MAYYPAIHHLVRSVSPFHCAEAHLPNSTTHYTNAYPYPTSRRTASQSAESDRRDRQSLIAREVGLRVAAFVAALAFIALGFGCFLCIGRLVAARRAQAAYPAFYFNSDQGTRLVAGGGDSAYRGEAGNTVWADGGEVGIALTTDDASEGVQTWRQQLDEIFSLRDCKKRMDGGGHDASEWGGGHHSHHSSDHSRCTVGAHGGGVGIALTTDDTSERV